MSDELNRAKEISDAVSAADAKKRADADAGSQLDKLLSYLDAMNGKFDSFSSRLDAMETSMMDSKKKADAEGEIEEKGDPKELTADFEIR